MKFFVVFSLVLVAAHCLTEDEKREKLKGYRHECASVNGIPDETIRKAVHGEHFEETEAMKQYTLCMMKKIHFMDENDEITKDSMKKILMKMLDNDETKVDAMITKCAIKRDTPGNTAGEMMKCMHAESPKFLPASD